MLVDGADIGIAFYVSTGDSTYTGQNVQSLGLSSGKIAYYLRAGIPVIVNQAGSISELLRREKCGIVVENGQEIGRAIAEIAQQYESTVNGPVRCSKIIWTFVGDFRKSSDG